MATPTTIRITPATLTDLIIVVESTNGIEVKTLADCTVGASAINLSLATGSYNLRFYSQGYNVGILENVSGLGNSIELTPTSDYIKTSDGTNDYYVKDNYSRQFGDDLLDIVMTKADISDIPTAISDLTDDTSTTPIDKAESVADQRDSSSLKYWTGTKAQYDVIVTKDTNTLYNIEGVGLYKGNNLISGAMPNSANQSLSNLDTTGQAVIDGKADTSLSNITNTAKIAIARNAMPSGTYTDLTLSASGAKYTAPANGWFQFAWIGAGASCQFYNDSAGSFWETKSGDTQACSIQAKKGDTIKQYYTMGSASMRWFRFYYAVGSESEAQ